MKLHIKDIPQVGKNIEFPLENQDLNSRLKFAEGSKQKKRKNSDKFSSLKFIDNPLVTLELKIKGETVQIKGVAKGSYKSPCARCGEGVVKEITVDIGMFLKPRHEGRLEDEDVGFGFYEGEEVDCSSLVAEHFILALPIVVHCPEGAPCLSELGAENLKTGRWEFGEEPENEGDERLSVLRSLKIH